jgi:hypothetical protein
VVFEQDREEGWERDDAGAGRGFGWAQPLAMCAFLECAEVGVDDDDPVVRMEVGSLQAGEFAPAGACPGGGDDQ